VCFHDPAVEAKELKVGQYRAAKQATMELKSVLQAIADFYMK